MAPNHYNTSFSIEKKEVMLVKPSKPVPCSHALSLSTIDNDHNLQFLCQTIYVYKSSNHTISSINGHSHHENGNHNNTTTHDHNVQTKSDHNNQTDPVSLIQKALSDVLVFYYPLAGMMKRESDGKLQINLNAIGVPFLVANADCQLSSLHYLDGIDVETAQKFVFDFPSDPNEGEHPLVLQVTKFSCGGFTIGMGLSHSVCDGFGAAQFFRAMVELASGKSEPSIKPIWEREKLIAKATPGPPKFIVDPTCLATSPFLPTNDMLHECFNVNAESIKQLKMALIKECEGNHADHDHETQGNLYFTTIEVLSAYVWRARFRALKLNPDAKTLFGMAMNIRHHLNPPLPDGYYGNAFISANVVLKGKDLNEMPLSETAKLIKGSKKYSSTNEYIYTTLGILERMRELNVKFEGCGATMALTDWRQIGLIEEVDFGWGGSVNLVPVPWNMFGYVDLCLFLPPNHVNPTMKLGGVRVHVSLPRAAMPKFKEEMDALMQG